MHRSRNGLDYVPRDASAHVVEKEGEQISTRSVYAEQLAQPFGRSPQNTFVEKSLQFLGRCAMSLVVYRSCTSSVSMLVRVA